MDTKESDVCIKRKVMARRLVERQIDQEVG